MAAADRARWLGISIGWQIVFGRHVGMPTFCGRSLRAEKGISLSLRTIEREVAPLRRELGAEARATVRFETPPGKQLQIDFGERRVLIGEMR